MNLEKLSPEEMVRAEASADRLLALHERHEILTRELTENLRAFLGEVHDLLEERRQGSGDAGSPPPDVPGPADAAGQQ